MPKKYSEALERRLRAQTTSERTYLRTLMKVCSAIEKFIDGFEQPQAPDDELPDFTAMIQALLGYADILKPWARAQAARMLDDVVTRDLYVWRAQSETIARGLRRELASSEWSDLYKERLEQNARLITSLPREAAERVQAIAQEARIAGWSRRYAAEEVAKVAPMTQARARVIARTEVSRIGTEITRARAVSIGSTHFRWRSVKDVRVRPSHAVLDGKVFPWDQPPLTDAPDIHALPGCVFNCRCVAIAVLPDLPEE